MATNQAKLNQAIETIEWDVIEGGNTDISVQYPRFQWIHGEAKASGINKTGGLFVAAENYPNFQADGFQPETLITRDGTEIKGFGAGQTKLAVIRIKHQWVKDDRDGGRNIPLVHALAVVKGSDDVVCVSLRGASKALAFQKAFDAHMQQNVALANRTRPQTASALEPYALWFPLKSGPLSQAHSKNSSAVSNVTYPELAVPESHSIDYVRSLWVGADRYKSFVSIWRETKDWQNQAIYEQRNGNGEHELPEYTGSDYDRATDEQITHLLSICNVKNIDTKELALTVTGGESDQVENFTRVEARNAIAAASKA